MSKIITYTRRFIDPCEPDSESIAIEDIAHALSLVCRSGGQFPSFYSVAQHSIACAKEAKARAFSKKVQLFCLLHDASEAYISDITRPVKHRLSDYLLYEKALQEQIYKKFVGSIPNEDEQSQIDMIDNAMLCEEFEKIMDYEIAKKETELLTQINTDFRPFSFVQEEFLSLFETLQG